jgi:hypothetical protein
VDYKNFETFALNMEKDNESRVCLEIFKEKIAKYPRFCYLMCPNRRFEEVKEILLR